MNRFIKKWNGRAIEDDLSITSKEFHSFANALKNALKRELEGEGIELVKYYKGHYDISGMFEKGGKYIYFSYNVPRYGQPLDMFSGSIFGGALYRTSPSADSCSSGHGHNQFTTLAELPFAVKCKFGYM